MTVVTTRQVSPVPTLIGMRPHPTLTVRRLSLLQLVSVDLGEKHEQIDCRVGAIDGGRAVLAPVGDISPSAQARLASDPACYLVFEDRASPVAGDGPAAVARADAMSASSAAIAQVPSGWSDCTGNEDHPRRRWGYQC